MATSRFRPVSWTLLCGLLSAGIAAASDLPSDALEKARLAEGSYGGAPVEGYELVKYEADSRTGFEYAVYRSRNTKEVVLAFAGTDPHSGHDWWTDSVQLLDGVPRQYNQAVMTAAVWQRRAAEEGAPRFSLTGHSLGGGLAQFAAMATGVDATVFNPAGLGPGSVGVLAAQRLLGWAPKKPEIREIRSLWDQVNLHGMQFGDVYTLTDTFRAWNPLGSAHSMDTIIRALENRESEALLTSNGPLVAPEGGTETVRFVYAGESSLLDTRHLDDVRNDVIVNSGVLDLARRQALHAVDVFFLCDNTGSMGDFIAAAQENATAILDALAGSDPRFQGVQIEWGVARYLGDPSENAAGEPPYTLLQTITGDRAAVQTAINAWSADGGGDTPEAGFFATQQVVTDGAGTPRNGSNATGQATGWRSAAARVVLVFGDAPSHQETVNEKELRGVLEGEGTKVSFIDVAQLNGGDPSSHWDATYGQQQTGAAEELADGSGGAYVQLTDVNAVVSATLDAVFDAIADNRRTGGQLTRIDAAKTWRSRTPSSVTAETPDGGATFDFTLRYPGQTDATFAADLGTGIAVPGALYLEKDSIIGGTNMFGANLSSDALVQFTRDKSFVRFLLRNGSGSAIEGYYGLHIDPALLPTSGVQLYDLSSRSVSPYDGNVYSSNELTTRLSINWTTGRVFGIDVAPPTPGVLGPYVLPRRIQGDPPFRIETLPVTPSALGGGMFLGEVDRPLGRIDGVYLAETSGLNSPLGGGSGFIEDSARGNTNLAIFGKSLPVGLGGTFSVNWGDGGLPSRSSFLAAGFLNPTSTRYTDIAEGETWKGFATAYATFYYSGLTNDGYASMVVRSSDPNDVQMTFLPDEGRFVGSIRTPSTGVLATDADESTYVSPQAFGAIEPYPHPEQQLRPAYIATTTNGNENYDYLTWGAWGYEFPGNYTVFPMSPWIAGRLTPDAAVPTSGSATYSGDAWGQLVEPDQLSTVHGTTSLTADFGTRSLTGTFNDMRRGDGSAWTSANVNASWAGGTNLIVGSVNAANGMAGDVRGAFFGPAAEELGGNWTLFTQDGTTQAGGVFTGKR